MSKIVGMSINDWTGIGRVVGTPVIQNGWAQIQFKTIIAEPDGQGNWTDVESIIPLITNKPSTVNTIQQYVQDERQLTVKGYIKVWEGGWGVMINILKLGLKTAFDPDNAQQGGNQFGNQQNNQMNGQMGNQMGGQPPFPQ